MPRHFAPLSFSSPVQVRGRFWVTPIEGVGAGGYLVCTLSHRSEEGYTEEDFFGVTMYWSNYGLSEYLEMLAGAGFVVVEASLTKARFPTECYDTGCENQPM